MTHKKSLVFLGAVFALAGVIAADGSSLARGMNGGRAEMGQAQRQLAEERKAAIKERIAAKREEIAQRLADKRLEICQKRQENIVNIAQRGTEQNKKQLAVFQTIEERVKQFYADKGLQSADYEAAVATADEKEAAAVAAIEVSSEVTFDCEGTDGTKPGSIIKVAMTTRHTNLKEYRTAIKDLILVVKHALGDSAESGAGAEHDHSSHDHSHEEGQQ